MNARARWLLVVVVGALLLWAALCTVRAHDPPAVTAGDVVAPTPSPRAPDRPAPARAPIPSAKPRAAERRVEPSSPNTLAVPSSDEVRAQLASRAAEQRAQSEARYAVEGARWKDERREEPWASEREQQLRTAATADGIDYLLVEVECRATLCRLEISAPDSNTAFALQRARTFAPELGKSAGASMIGSGPDRAMEVFIPREGTSLSE